METMLTQLQVWLQQNKRLLWKFKFFSIKYRYFIEKYINFIYSDILFQNT